MKKILKAIVFLLSALTVIGMYMNSRNQNEKAVEQLMGTWKMVAQDSQAQARILLENIDMYEEEIALADLNSLDYVWMYEFTQDRYRQYEDVASAKACVRAFYEGFFEDLYENRAAVDELYDDDLSGMSWDEFGTFYAGLYSRSSYEELISHFVSVAYSYEEWTDLNSGTYEIDGDFIVVGENETIGFTVSGDTLTLRYSDGVEVYTKVN